MKSFRIHGLSAAALGLIASLGLSGCNLFPSEPEVDTRKPAALNPEEDLFSTGDVRLFLVSEGILRAGKDTTFAARPLEITYLGDTIVEGTPFKRIDWGSRPPVAALTQLGLNPARLRFDTAYLPDPGPGLRFPDTPVVGWKLDTTVAELRHVRRLTGVKTVKAAGRYQECWVFSDSTYWGSAPVSTETYWMGASGLVLHRREWKGYAPAAMTGGTFWREIRATN